LFFTVTESFLRERAGKAMQAENKCELQLLFPTDLEMFVWDQIEIIQGKFIELVFSNKRLEYLESMSK
jgi:hypothetical protein